MEETGNSPWRDLEAGARGTSGVDNTGFLTSHDIHRTGSKEFENRVVEFRKRLASGDTLYLVGFTATWHNSGISLIKVSQNGGITPLLNNEEERFTGIKHFSGFPAESCREVNKYLDSNSIDRRDIFAILYSFDVIDEEHTARDMAIRHIDIVQGEIYQYVSKVAVPELILDEDCAAKVAESSFFHSPALVTVTRRIRRNLQLDGNTPCIAMPHHECHAYFSYATSPFYSDEASESTMVVCIDGSGDRSSTSLFIANGHQIELDRRNERIDSLGVFYMICASMLGGWSPLSAEGRYMGATAWGDQNRLTNPFYRELRQFFRFCSDGQVRINAASAKDNFEELERIIGPFVQIGEIWQPDRVLNVDSIQHSPITQRRVDIAAAVQMVFEDALFHIIGGFVMRSQTNRIVLCGGTALNCVANMRLLENFDRGYFQRYLRQDATLNLWVPPIPSDQGAVVGAAYQFAMKAGAKPDGPLRSPFLCGTAPTNADIRAAIANAGTVSDRAIGSLDTHQSRTEIAEIMAYFVSNNAVVGVFDKQAETGPRALGHRSILSNPCNPRMLDLLNNRVKHREKIRPLAPMVTLEDAEELFELSEGAKAGSYSAYDYMVLTVKAKPKAHILIPAVIHHDGTSRIQIVRKYNNPLMWAYLKALKRYLNVCVSVNTSLNVGSPIVQSPEQALKIFGRAKGLDAIFFISNDNAVTLTWPANTQREMPSRVPALLREYRPLSTIGTRAQDE